MLDNLHSDITRPGLLGAVAYHQPSRPYHYQYSRDSIMNQTVSKCTTCLAILDFKSSLGFLAICNLNCIVF